MGPLMGEGLPIPERFSKSTPMAAVTGYVAKAGLLKASDGKFYGTTFYGGRDGFGTVFRLNQDGSAFQTLHHFQGTNFSDGAGPHAPLIEGSDGLLYGTTQWGGL